MKARKAAAKRAEADQLAKEPVDGAVGRAVGSLWPQAAGTVPGARIVREQPSNEKIRHRRAELTRERRQVEAAINKLGDRLGEIDEELRFLVEEDDDDDEDEDEDDDEEEEDEEEDEEDDEEDEENEGEEEEEEEEQQENDEGEDWYEDQ